MNTENITRVRRLDLNTVLYSGSAYQSQGSSAAGHWINDQLLRSPICTNNFDFTLSSKEIIKQLKWMTIKTRFSYFLGIYYMFKFINESLTPWYIYV